MTVFLSDLSISTNDSLAHLGDHLEQCSVSSLLCSADPDNPLSAPPADVHSFGSTSIIVVEFHQTAAEALIGLVAVAQTMSSIDSSEGSEVLSTDCPYHGPIIDLVHAQPDDLLQEKSGIMDQYLAEGPEQCWVALTGDEGRLEMDKACTCKAVGPELMIPNENEG
jgi:hypothetical protein